MPGSNSEVCSDGIDDQRLADRDQTTSDADQTGADLDQTAADLDQSAADRDQRSCDRDQQASDDDEAAWERALAAGASSGSYEERIALVDTLLLSRRTRSQTTLARDMATQTRADSARVREADAQRRDRAADDRDAAALDRDELAAALDAEMDRLEREHQESGPELALNLLVRASADRTKAAAMRARAAAQRDAAARDREMAALDRVRAMLDRRAAAAELAAEGTDHLTGALRRRVGIAAIQREIDRTWRTREKLVLAFVDVNGLKAVNDTHGHAAGDRVLAEVARCITAALRPYDVVMRYGGDEFVCSLAGNVTAARNRFTTVAARLADAGAAISVGFAERLDDEDLDDLIARADDAMRASRNGPTRNRR